MTQHDVSADVMALFNNMNDAAAQAEVDQGLGRLGWWPPPGDHECILEDVAVGKGEFRYFIGGAPNLLECAEVQFTFRLINDPDAPSDQPRTFRDRAFLLLTDPQVASLPETQDKARGGKQQTRARMEFGRFKGHCAAILGLTEIPDIAVAIQEVLKAKAYADSGGSVIPLTVRCLYDEGERKDGSKYQRPDRCFVIERN